MAGLLSLPRWIALFAIAIPGAVLLCLLSYVRPMRELHPLARAVFRAQLRVLGVRMVVKGREHVDPARGYIYMGNHVNFLEPFMMASEAPQWVVALEKASNFKLPFYGWLIRRWGNVPIERENRQAALRSLELAKETLASGVSIAILPEGTRSPSGELLPFKKGGFHMAIDAGATIVPFAYRNLPQLYQPGSLRLTPTVVELEFLPPIDASRYDKESLDALLQRVRSAIATALAAPAAAPALDGQAGLPYNPSC